MKVTLPNELRPQFNYLTKASIDDLALTHFLVAFQMAWEDPTNDPALQRAGSIMFAAHRAAKQGCDHNEKLATNAMVQLCNALANRIVDEEAAEANETPNTETSKVEPCPTSH